VRKAIAYSLIAAVLGILLMLLPILASAQFKIEKPEAMSSLKFFSEHFRNLEAPALDSETRGDGITGVEVLGFSFVIACLAYLSVKHKSKYKYYRWVKPY